MSISVFTIYALRATHRRTLLKLDTILSEKRLSFQKLSDILTQFGQNFCFVPLLITHRVRRFQVGYGSLVKFLSRGNDAKSQYGSRVDVRHEHIGEGNIGITPFQLLVNDPRFENIPMVIETPKMESIHLRHLRYKAMHAANLAVLRGLVKDG